VAPSVTGIVLAAGASSRLGRLKQLLPLGDTTLLGWVVREAERTSLDRICVVVGGGADEVARSITPTRAEVVRNGAYRSGCASSLAAGLEAAGDCDAVALLLGDMPGVDAAVIDDVLDRWRADPSWAAVTSYRGRLGHPFLFSAAAFADLRALHGGKAVWKIVDGASEATVRRLPVDRDLPGDVDTWDDYRAVTAALGLTGG
jgi:molybdenum cofactor cytidylyltransferase